MKVRSMTRNQIFKSEMEFCLNVNQIEDMIKWVNFGFSSVAMCCCMKNNKLDIIPKTDFIVWTLNDNIDDRMKFGSFRFGSGEMKFK